jgi:hypothetical protein
MATLIKLVSAGTKDLLMYCLSIREDTPRLATILEKLNRYRYGGKLCEYFLCLTGSDIGWIDGL